MNTLEDSTLSTFLLFAQEIPKGKLSGKSTNFLSINILTQLPCCFSENFQFIFLLALHKYNLQTTHFIKMYQSEQK